MFHRFLISTVAVSMLAAPVLAEDTALILSNTDYRYEDDVRSALNIGALAQRLEQDGFTVHGGANARVSGLLNLARRAAATVDSDDRLIVILQGNFANYHNVSYLLGVRARTPDRFDLSTQGLSVNAILAVLSEHPGQALFVLAGSDLSMDADGGVAYGRPNVDAPQGVSVVSGRGRQVSDALNLVLDGEDLDSVSGLSGFAPAAPFGGRQIREITKPDRLTEDDYWQVVKAIDSLEAYEKYLSAYPQGAHRAEARDAIEFIEDAPLRDARSAEDELGLDREERRGVQANLTILGFDTRGVDGVFGRGSRAAIGNWQALQGYPKTGFLTGNQILLLEQQGATRQAEIEEEERKAEAVRLEEDRDYWWDTGRGRNADGLKKYLERYPDGQYAEQARARLQKLEPSQDQLTAKQVAQDKAQEAQIAQNPITRLLIEKGLERLNFKPGRVDARFDQSTRNAIRAFQKSVGLAQTGFVGQSTLTKLLNNQ